MVRWSTEWLRAQSAGLRGKGREQARIGNNGGSLKSDPSSSDRAGYDTVRMQKWEDGKTKSEVREQRAKGAGRKA
jgi:hypothetical protein